LKSSVLNSGWGRLLPLLILISCSTKSEKNFNKLIEKGKCEEASLRIPDFQVQKSIEEGITYPATGMSYMLTTAAYGVDVVYYVTGGIALPVVACMPAMFVDTQSTAVIGSRTSDKCFETVHNFAVKYDSFGNPKTLGEKVYKKTAAWRCPDLDFAVDNLMKISKCYKDHGLYAKARLQLQNILDEQSFGGCVSVESQKRVEQELDSIH
jgi:hypothetical protein